jgi:hypothetical protein
VLAVKPLPTIDISITENKGDEPMLIDFDPHSLTIDEALKIRPRLAMARTYIRIAEEMCDEMLAQTMPIRAREWRER